MRNRPLVLTSAIVVTVLAALASGCSKKGDPIRETLDAVVKAANARDVEALLDNVATDFEAADGTGRLDTKLRLEQYFSAYEILDVSVSDVQIERGEEAAFVRLRASMSGQPRKVGGLEGLVPSSAKYDFELRLIQEGKAWKLAWAAWAPVGD